MGLRNMAGQLLTNGLSNAFQGAGLGGGVKERGWAVAGGLGLDSMAINAFFSGLSATSKLTGGRVNSALQTLGTTYAAQGGKMTRGHFIWTEPDGAEYPGQNRFTFPMNPESIEESLNPIWAETPVPGQNRPMYQFINGGPREVTFTLNFFYETRAREVIRDQIDALKSLTQRRHTGQLAGAYDGPPSVYFFYGDYFAGERFIVTALQIKAYDLFDPKTLLPMRADVDITLKEVMDTMAVGRGASSGVTMRSNNIGTNLG